MITAPMIPLRSHPLIPCINQVFLRYLVSLTLKSDLHRAILQAVCPEITSCMIKLRKQR
ncbi:hypothetical protein Hanom_Chr06g00488591 [Helianthus anomalus]